jgi:hypothetical protein
MCQIHHDKCQTSNDTNGGCDIHLELVDLVIDQIVHFWIKPGRDALLAGELIECCARVMSVTCIIRQGRREAEDGVAAEANGR